MHVNCVLQARPPQNYRPRKFITYTKSKCGLKLSALSRPMSWEDSLPGRLSQADLTLLPGAAPSVLFPAHAP